MTLTEGWSDAALGNAALRDAALDDAALDSVRNVLDDGETTRGVTAQILEHVRRLVRADQVISFEFDLSAHKLIEVKSAPHVEVRCDAMFQRAFWSAYSECASRELPRRSDRVTVTILSDFYTTEQLQQSRMYQLCRNFVPLDYAMTAVLPSPAGIEARIVFSRCHQDFDDRDRTMLDLLSPHLAAAHRRATERRTGVAALTPRQQTILHLVARGLSNEEIARRLVVSQGTVRKHLDNAFRQLGVSSRAAAVARAFPEGVPPYSGSASGAGQLHHLPQARDGRTS